MKAGMPPSTSPGEPIYADPVSRALGFRPRQREMTMNAIMSDEQRALSAAELELVTATQSPALEQLPLQDLKALVRRLRQAHSRAKDIGERQRREIRGKLEPRGAKPVQDNTGSLTKAQILHDALHRADSEIARRDTVVDGAPTQADYARRALELKMNAKAPDHPDPGRTGAAGMAKKKRDKPVKIGTTKKEVGRVSQAGKVAQARKDSGKA
jgi:hypothetical protein